MLVSLRIGFAFELLDVGRFGRQAGKDVAEPAGKRRAIRRWRGMEVDRVEFRKNESVDQIVGRCR